MAAANRVFPAAHTGKRIVVDVVLSQEEYESAGCTDLAHERIATRHTQDQMN